METEVVGPIAMGHDLDLKGESLVATEDLPGKENGSVPGCPEDKPMHCVSNYEDRNFHVEAFHDDEAMAVDRNEDMEIDIIECRNTGDNGQVEARSGDETESMSSFGDTVSQSEYDSVLGDDEVESQSCIPGAPMLTFYGYGGTSRMRRKKLTDHWRRFIRPLMWRCKWMELQIKEFQSQALKYDRQLAELEQRKQFDFETFMVEGLNAKSLPFSSCIQRNKAMKRKKRKRFEETADVASYMLQHNLFSYYENKKSTTDGASVGDDCIYTGKTVDGSGDFGFEIGLASLESRDSILEDVLRKIEGLQSQVRMLKDRTDKVVNENSLKFASLNRLSLSAPSDALTNSDQNPTSLPENEDRMPIRSPYTLSKHTSECNMRDRKPESAVSSHGEIIPLPEMIESTSQQHVGVSCENAEEGTPSHNDAPKEENLENLGIQQTEKLQVPTEKQRLQASEHDLPVDAHVARVHYGGKSLPKSRSNVSNIKRKRGRRKSRAGGWNRRSKH